MPLNGPVPSDAPPAPVGGTFVGALLRKLGAIMGADTPRAPTLSDLIDPSNAPKRSIYPHADAYPGLALQAAGNRLDAIQRTLNPGTDLFNAGAKRSADFAANPPMLQTQSPAINLLSAVPSVAAGAIGSGVSRLEGGLADSLVDQIALMGLGSVAKAARVIPAMGKGIRGAEEAIQQYAPGFSLTFRGGQLPSSQAAGAVRDAAWNTAEVTSKKLSDLMGKGPEIPVVKRLVQQPAIAQSLVGSTEQVIDPEAWKALAGRVPGYLEAKPLGTLPQGLLPKPMASYADAAEQIREQMGNNKAEMKRLLIRDPSYFARFNEGNYFPEVYVAPKMEQFPGTGMANIRERMASLATRSDMTTAEREALDAAHNPAGVLAQRNLAQMRLIATRQYFTTIASDPSVTVPPSIMGEGWTGQAGKYYDIGGQKYMLMADSEGLGPLKGQLVRGQEASEINAMANPNNSLMGELLKTWRFGKVILNPASYVKAFTTNGIAMMNEGLTPGNPVYGQVIQDIYKQGPWYQTLMAANAPYLQGTARGALRDIVEEAGLGRSSDGDALHNAFSTAGRIVRENPVSTKLASIFQAHLSYLKSILTKFLVDEKGMPLSDAIEYADKKLVNYEQQPVWVKQVRSSAYGIPFITFDIGQVPNAAKMVVEKPQVLQRAKIFLDSWNEAAGMGANITPDERQSIAQLYPGQLPAILPFRDGHGKLMVVLLSRYNPYQRTFDMVRGFREEGAQGVGLPGALQGATNLFSRNPFFSGLTTMASGIDPASGRTISPPLGTLGNLSLDAQRLGKNPQEKVLKMLQDALSSQATRGQAAYAGRLALPELLGGGAMQRVIDAIAVKPDFMGNVNTIPGALAQIFTGAVHRPMDERTYAAMRLPHEIEAGEKALTRMRSGR